MQRRDESDSPPTPAAEWLRSLGMLLACGLMVGGIIAIPWLLSLHRSWVAGLVAIVALVPVIPALQSLLLGEQPASLRALLSIYAAELASLILQLLLLAATLPVVAFLVAGRLATALLLAGAIAWSVVGLQRLGVQVGRRMSGQDLTVLLWATLGLLAAVAGFFALKRFGARYEDGYYRAWAGLFARVRAFFRDSGSGPTDTP